MVVLVLVTDYGSTFLPCPLSVPGFTGYIQRASTLQGLPSPYDNSMSKDAFLVTPTGAEVAGCYAMPRTPC